jgi:hypothetical protein
MLSLTFAAILLFTGCSSTIDTKIIKQISTPLHVGSVVNKLPDDAKGAKYTATAQETDALQNMTMQLENEYAALYLDMSNYGIAVRDKRTGHIWFSNPELCFSDEISKSSDEATAEANSQLKIEYYDDQGKQFFMTSFPDAANGNDMNQVKVIKQDNVLKLLYTFGKDEEQLVICRVMTEDHFNKTLQDAQTLLDSGEIMTNQFAVFQNSYSKITLQDAQADPKLMKQYPQLKKHKTLYILHAELSDVIKSQLENVFYKTGWTLNKVKSELKIVGQGGEEQLGSPNFKVPIEYQLQGPDLLASVMTDEIKESKGMLLHKVSFLNSLGAAKNDTDGYSFLPDGSGVLIDNKGRNSDQYSLNLRFYGSDLGLDLYSNSQLSPDVIFPVFGIKSNQTALFGIVESGEANGGVLAQQPGVMSSYNRVGCWLEYRAMDTAILDQNISRESQMVLLAKNPANIEYRVRYHFLYGDQSEYAGMADYYRTYLEQTGVLKRLDISKASNLNIEILGAVDKKKQVVGFPITVKEPLTSFKQASKMADQLNNAGIQHASFSYAGWMNGGMQYSLASEAKAESVLGGASGIRDLSLHLEKLGFDFYPEVDISHIFKTRLGSGYQVKRDAVKYLNKTTAVTGSYNPASGALMLKNQGLIINPSSYQWILNRFLPTYDKLGIKGISATSLGSDLGGDYHGDSQISREVAKNDTVQALKSIYSHDHKIQLETGNAYSLPYANSLVGVPLTSSGYRIENASIQFVPMVIHGYISYCGPALNLSQNFQNSFLQAVQSGANLNFQLMAAENDVLKNTTMDGSYSISDVYWMDKIIEIYKTWNKDFADLSTKRITGYKQDGDIKVTIYEDETRVYVNFADSERMLDGITVSSFSYAVVKGQAGK